MTETREIVAYLDTLLETAAIPDYPNALNGLQLANGGTVSKIAACVDFSSKAVNQAVEEQADLLMVHHGMFWGGLRRLTSHSYSRLRMLVENRIAVYSSHLPLDRHPTFGNNVLLSRQLGLTPSAEFAKFRHVFVGLRGEADVATGVLLERARQFSRLHGGNAIATGFDPQRITMRWAICTGAGASADTLQEAAESGVDTLIVGEGPHHTAVEAEELGIVIIYAGHYATETLGVSALAEHVAGKFAIGWAMIHAPTGL